MEIITSEQNIRIKNLLKLKEKSRDRKKQGLFLIDGAREIKEAITAGFVIKELYLCKELSQEEYNQESFFVSLEIFKKICYKEKPEGCLAVACRRDLELDDLKISKQPLVVVLEGVEKPGNLGAIVRSSYAAGVDLIVVNDEQTDIYNPNVIRASQGLIFKLAVVVTSFEKTVNYFKNKKIKIIATSIKATKKHTEINFKKGSAIILGTEADGLSDKWIEVADELLRIPMKSGMDSLNVSVSAAILIFEAWRQRDFN